MAYTEEEIRAAVEKLMVTKTRFPVDDRAGTRGISVTFNDIQEAAASVFLLNHDALFYLASLSAKRLRYNVAVYRDAVQQIHALVGALERTSVPITNVTPLEDAKAALLQLEGVAGSRTTGVGTSSPYVRFRSKVNEFLALVKSNVVQGGDIVPSMVEAKGTISRLIATLPQTHADVVRRLELIAGVQNTYAALQLPQIMLTSTVAKARKLVGYKAYRIKNQSEEQNQIEIKETVLDLLATKAVMKRAALFSEPRLTRTLTGTASPYADASHEATPAETETVAGPFDIRNTGGSGSSNLTFEFDGSTATYNAEIASVTEIVQLCGLSSGPFTFTSSDTHGTLTSLVIGSPTFGAGMELIVFVSYLAPDVTTKSVSVALTAGLTSAAVVAADIQSAFVAANVDGYFLASEDSGRLVLSSLVAGSGPYMQIVSFSDELVDVLGAHWQGAMVRGLDTNNVLNIRTGSLTSPQEQFFTFLDGTFTVDEVVARITALKPPSFPIEASAVLVSYATPPYKVLCLRYTGMEDDAILMTLPTYDPGSGELPATAYKVLWTYGALDRQAARMTPLNLLDALRQQTEISNRTLMDVVNGRVVIASRSAGLDSRVKVSGDGCQQFFGAPSVEVFGTTGWVRLSEQNDVSEGDRLDVSTTGLYTVDAVEGEYVHFSRDMAVDHPTINLGTQTGVYGTMTYGKKETLDSLSSSLFSWLEQWKNISTYLLELNRLLNLVLVDKNPTSGEINDVQAHLSNGTDGLLEALDSVYSLLEGHTVERAEELDDIIRTYREKGCERAVDLLLECRLEDFFGLTLEEASYAGKMLQAVKAVAMNDMPVNRYDRRTGTSRLLATVPSPDYDRDFSDSDEDMFNDDHFAIDAD